MSEQVFHCANCAAYLAMSDIDVKDGETQHEQGCSREFTGSEEGNGNGW